MARTVTPLGAILRGLTAGAAGSVLQTLFFKATGKLTPAQREAFEPPEPAQKEEGSTETVARRWMEGMMQRGPMTPNRKRRGASLVHMAYGSTWGALYGAARESWPGLKNPLGSLGFSTAVMLTSDALVLPAFRLAAWPHKYSLQTHAFSLAAHAVYGLGVWGAYEALRPRSWAAAAATMWAICAKSRLDRRMPRSTWPAVNAVVDALASLKAAGLGSRMRDAAAAFAS